MWLNGGYYYRGMTFAEPDALEALSKHLGGPERDETYDRENESSWAPVFEFIEDEAKNRGGANSYSGEDWPQIIGTWDRVLLPHAAKKDEGTGEAFIPEASDKRRKKDLCACNFTKDNTQSPECDLPNYRQPLRQ